MALKHKIKNLHKTHTYHVIAAGAVTLLLLVSFLQVLYPDNKMLPMATIGGINVGGWESEDVIDRLHDEYNSIPVEIRIPNNEPIETSSAEVGVTPKYRDALERAHGYSLRERLIPFSFIYKTAQYSNVPLRYEIDDEILKRFMTTVSERCDEAPKDADLKLKGDEVALDPAESGQKCQTQDVKSALEDEDLSRSGMTVRVEPTRIQPERTNDEVQDQLAQAKNIVQSGLTVRSPTDEQWSVPKDTLVSWLQVVEKDDQLSIELREGQIKEYLRTLRGELYIEPGVTRIVLLDGIEVERHEGRQGRGVDVEETYGRVRATLLNQPDDNSAWIQLTVLQPEVVYERNYTSTDAGLQALLVQWDQNNTGQYGIIVRDLSGKGMSASLNPQKDFVPASTYKMFLVYAVLSQVEKGEISMDTGTNNGMSVKACIDETIINSTNYCAHALFDLVGRRYVHDFVRSQGFRDTIIDNSLSPDGEKHTTPTEEANFLMRLNSGSLLNKEHTDYLLGLMKRQIYKAGIPKGVPGVPVANKVGFYDNYKHDVAVIYAPRGTYILTVMSYGGSDAKFADLSRRVAELMN